ncbi:MAG: CDC27 family protein [Sulfurimonas sp.]|uniref:CDC27 family protein n=1 Tax=Sulfurimonas sp. TaxID=2022749 RepID=UPI00261560BC|nr:CDC27 family protein [Sulfurimonas sp.]MDD3475794.1 CDC27 family protein [Sulfurimonas sp.]
MLNVSELEFKHKKYKRSFYYRYLIIFSVVIIGLIPILLFTLFDEKVEIQTTKQQAIITPIIEEKNDSITQDSNSTLIIVEENISKKEKIIPIIETKEIEDNSSILEEKRVLLTPSLSFIDRIESSNTQHITNVISDIKEVEVENIEPIIEEVKPKEQIIVNNKIESIEKTLPRIEDKKTSINIERKDEESDIADVIKRFNINHNPALSLFIAKKYYQLGNYEQAYNYALMTNDLNNNIEGSWIIFSKSLVKMNKKELAIETLKKYISYSNSSQAKQLLDEITSGKFK